MLNSFHLVINLNKVNSKFHENPSTRFWLQLCYRQTNKLIAEGLSLEVTVKQDLSPLGHLIASRNSCHQVGLFSPCKIIR